MKYKVGDKVRIKSLDWYNENKGNADKTNSVWCEDGGAWFFYHMSQYCGKIMTIENVWALSYTLEGSDSRWTDEMIEGLVEEETKSIDFTIKATDTKGKVEVVIPEGYGYVVENDKLYFITKKKEYPKTYDECCKVLDFCGDYFLTTYDAGCMVKKEVYGILQQVNSLTRLLICRNAYWKIAGKEMGLGKPWKNSKYEVVYGICRDEDIIVKRDDYWGDTHAFEFPIREMRDAFYENFKELIENCKELL